MSAPATRTRPITWLLLALIIAAAVAGSVWWTRANVVLVGRDSAGHLEQSLLVGQALAQGGAQGLFRALTLDDYRPPALYLATQIPYALVGTSQDSAQATNIALLALILLLTFLLARRVLCDGWALLATAITALLPMMAAMARLYYMENLLTAALLGNLLALLQSDGLRRRGPALLWGLTLGVALLIKWTAPIYILAPTLYVLWRTGTLRDLRTRAAWRALDWRRALLAAALALGLAWGWYWPNQAQVVELEMPLGRALPWLWALLWAPLIYGLLAPGGVGGNILTALLLAAALASLWYFPRIDFVNRLGDVAFGTDRGTQEAWNLLRWRTWTRYPSLWLSHHMGPLATLLILPPAVWGWWRARRTLAPDAIALALGVAFSWLLLTLLAQANARNLVPLLPSVAILLVVGLQALPRPAPLLVGGVWLAVLGAQWSLYTFDALYPLQQRTAALWVNGDYMAWPASGPSDPGYWIHPEVLETIERADAGQIDAEHPATLAMLVDTWEIHRGAFRYLIRRDGRAVEVTPLTEDAGRGWSDLLANEWLLAKSGDNRQVKAPGQELLARIERGDPLFHRLYKAEQTWELPNGDVVTLWHRAEGPPRPLDFPVVLLETAPVAEALLAAAAPHATLYATDADVATWVLIHGAPAAETVVIPEAESPAAEALAETTGAILALSRYRTPEVSALLHATAYVASETVSGEFALTVAGRPASPPPQAAGLAGAELWPGCVLESAAFPVAGRPGDVLPVELSVAGACAEAGLKLSVRLLGPDGAPVAQRDVAAAADQRLGLLIPPAATGPLTLAALLYDPATLAPLPTAEGSDTAPLATVRIE